MTLSTSERPEPKRAADVFVKPPLLQDEPVRLVLLADTHVPRRARDLPMTVWDEVAQADVVFHAGDWVSTELLDSVAAKAARLVACWGNNDGPVLRSRLRNARMRCWKGCASRWCTKPVAQPAGRPGCRGATPTPTS
jgi:hypothetical protein